MGGSSLRLRLIEPMDQPRKLRMLDMLVRIGLADSDALPDDITTVEHRPTV